MGIESLVGAGGNLSPGMLLSAYEQGVFPWYSEGEPILWHSPDPRFIIFPEKLHISESMRKVFKHRIFDLRLDSDFGAVIRACSEAKRPGQNGTWITEDMITAYTDLHRLGWVHSSEAYHENRLVGGCYGIRLGNAFFGESMFAKESNSSKAAFLSLACLLFSDGVEFIDCQVHTDHLESLGAVDVPRERFISLLGAVLADRNGLMSAKGMYTARDEDDRRGNWGERYPDFGIRFVVDFARLRSLPPSRKGSSSILHPEA